MKTLLLSFFIVISSIGFAQDFQWVNELTESSPDFSGSDPNAFEIVDVEVDANGYVYVLGNFRGSVDVSPGQSTLMLTSLGGIDLFIIKYNSQGDVQQTFVSANDGQLSGGTNTDEVAKDMVLSSDGYLYVTGYFEANYYFWGYYQESDVELESDCSHNMFVAKIGTGFYVEWAKEPFSCYADMDDEYISGEVITVKGTDQIFVGGHYYGYPSIVDGENFNSTDSKDDIFYAKIDDQGDYQWGKEIRSASDNQEYITGIAAASYLYVTGYFDEDASLDMNPGTGVSNITSSGDHDIFLGMYSISTGNFFSDTYVGSIGGTSDDYAISIDVDAYNNVYLSGYTGANVDLDIKSGTHLSSGGFIVKYNSYLSYTWNMSLGTVRGVAKIDADNQIVVHGRFRGTVDFNPLGVANNISSNSQYSSRYSTFMGKYSSNGALQMMKVLGGDKDMGYDISVGYHPETFNNVFLLGCSKASTDYVIYGRFEEIVDFDAGDGIAMASPTTYENGRYLAKYSHCYPTEITSLSNDQTLCEGSNLYLSTQATGNNLTYEWIIDGDPASGYHNIGDWTSSSLSHFSVSNINPSASGLTYECVVSSSCADPITSDVIDVTVERKPIINSSPGNVTQCEGENVTLTVSTLYATSHQWLVNDGSGSFQAISDDATYSGTQTAALTISNVSPAQSYYQYKCFVSGDCAPEIYSDPSTLIVNPNPNIQSNPSNIAVCVGNSATFSVSTNGSGLSYQWQSSSNGGASFTNIANGGAYSGAQTSTLTVSNVTSGFDNYEYRCIVSGTCGSDVTSNSAILTVNDLTVLSTQPVDKEECEYADISYSVNATGYNLNYRWQVNTGSGWNNLNNGGSYSNVTSPSLSISYLDVSLTGNQYRCLITSGCSANIYSDEADLTVSETPNITITSSEGTDLCDGETSALTISGGDASYTYQWRRNYSDLIGYNNNNLTINQSGAYSIYAENPTGCSSESDPITINVHSMPNATITVIGSSEFCEGGYAELIVPSGNGYSYQWYNNSSLVSGATSNSLITTESGNYHAVVNNTYSCESTSGTETIIVNPLPTVSLSPSNVEICQGEIGTITSNDNSDYIYQWKQNNLNISGENSNSLEVTENGMYNVYVMNSITGCSYTSAYVSTVVNALPNPEIQASGILTYCVDDQIDLTLSESYNHYLWNNSTSASSLTIDQAGTYSITVTDANGCQNFDEMIVTEELVPTPNICMVTVDTTVNKNLIIWENLPDVTGIASYNVYKLVNSSYQLLGNILYNDTTEFVDMTSEPSIHSDKYAIASVDSCGNIGSYSPYHQTMNLSIVDGSGDAVSLIWTKYIDEAGINNPTEYEIYRGVGELGYFASITGGLSDYNYNIPTTTGDERFIIIVQRPMGCSPLNNNNKTTGGPYYQSSSNIEDEGSINTGIKSITVENLSIYPNPMQDYTVIKSDKKIESLRLYSVTGELVKEIKNLNTNEFKLDRKALVKGTYILEINNSVHQKLMVE